MKQSLTSLFGMAVLLVAFMGMNVSAQYSIIAVSPPPTFTFNDLWHFTATRTDADNYTQFYVSLRIMGNNNQLKVKSNSSVFSLPVGTGYYNASNLSDLQPFTTSYYDGGLLQQAVSSGGFFPSGAYVCSYTLLGKSADGEFTPLAEDFIQVSVEALWPPMLLNPVDEDSIDTPYPLLTWTPAFGTFVTAPITYTLKMVELFSGQQPAQAILANPTYYSASGIPITMLPYPPAAQPIDTGKTYVWQVHAEAGGYPMGSSEIWSFTRVSPQTASEQVREKPFAKLSVEPGSYAVEVNDGMLRLAFEEALSDSDNALTFSIYKPDGERIADQTQLTQFVREGHNKIRISLCNNSTGFNLPKGYYRIEVVSQRGDTYRLNFYNNKNISACADQ